MAAREKGRDRISNLPDFIIHQILDYLASSKEAARTSILSKTWLQFYSTFPNLTFDEFDFEKTENKNRYNFINFVNTTLLRFQTLNLAIHKFKFSQFRVDHAPTYLLLDKSLNIALDLGVKELSVSVAKNVNFVPYTLPPTIFDSPKVLTHLRVYQCKFPQNVVTTSKCNAITFPFLRTLALISADIDDGMLQKMLSNSPSLEKIVLDRVSGFEKFRVRGLGELKIINVRLNDKKIDIDIEDAPSLRFLCYFGSYRCSCSLKVGSAPNLKCLGLGKLNISDKFVKELITKSPLLEDLVIFSCEGLERINVESCSLKRFHFGGCAKLKEVKIDAPSLLKVLYNGRNMLSLCLNNTREGLKDVKVEVYEDSQKVWHPFHPGTSLSEFTFFGKKFRFSLN